jgi:hypothetical protein
MRFLENRRRKKLDETIASATPAEFLADLWRLDTTKRRNRRIRSLRLESAQRVNPEAFTAWVDSGRL